MKIKNMAGHLIRRLQQNSTQVFTQHMKEAGVDLTSVQFAAMEAISSNPGIDQARVAALIAFDRATIGGVIDRLEAKGYIARRVSQRDRRAREVNLTEVGQALLNSVRPIVVSLQNEILTGLDDDERKALVALMKKTVYPAPD